jgi:hypothetical protein
MKAVHFFKMYGTTCPVVQLHIPEELNCQNITSIVHCLSLLSIVLCGRKHVIKCWLVNTVTCCYALLQFINMFWLCCIDVIHCCLQNQKSQGVYSRNLQARVPLAVPSSLSLLILHYISCLLNYNANQTRRFTKILESKFMNKIVYSPSDYWMQGNFVWYFLGRWGVVIWDVGYRSSFREVVTV